MLKDEFERLLLKKRNNTIFYVSVNDLIEGNGRFRRRRLIAGAVPYVPERGWDRMHISRSWLKLGTRTLQPLYNRGGNLLTQVQAGG